MDYTTMRKTLLKTSVGFLVLTAVVGIVSVLSGEFGELQIKILSTCLAVSCASICSMACAAFVERKKHKAPGLAGISLSVAAAALAILGMWSKIENDEYWKATATVGVCAVALAHGFLLLLPELSAPLRWIQTVASVSIALLTLLGVVAIWGEIEAEGYYRVLAVIAIVVGLETLVIPILTRFGQGSRRQGESLVLKRVTDDLYEEPSGRRYRVTQVSED